MSESSSLPDRINDVEQLEELLSRPTQYVVYALAKLEGDIIILGVAGKMGPTLARMARRAKKGGRVIGVSRFSNVDEQKNLESHGIETIKADLLDQKQLDKLPDAPNIVYMAGMKFGATGNESLTWAMNTYLPGMVSNKYARSRIVAFSTGNVYGLSPVIRGGSIESDPMQAAGDYAMSCVGRERIFEHFSRTLKIPMSIIRLNYATEMRYGVLVDLARKVFNDEVIDVTMSNFNVIWQADANAMALASFADASVPPFVLNVAGPELLSIRSVCTEFGKVMNKTPKFTGVEASDALLSNGQLGHRRYGYPTVSAQQMLPWIADWVARGGKSLNKPTHFEARDGKY